MTQLTLTPHERQELKGRAHRLNPVVLLGAEGLTEAVVKEVDRALNAHGLIKIKVPGSGFSQLVELLKREFVTVGVRKPAASRAESAETYLFARGLKQQPR